MFHTTTQRLQMVILKRDIHKVSSLCRTLCQSHNNYYCLINQLDHNRNNHNVNDNRFINCSQPSILISKPSKFQVQFQRTFSTHSLKSGRKNINVKGEFSEHFQKGTPDDVFYAMRNPQRQKRPKVQHKIEKVLGLVTILSIVFIGYMMYYYETRLWRDDVNKLPPKEKKSDAAGATAKKE